jgi:hypothetical protein
MIRGCKCDPEECVGCVANKRALSNDEMREVAKRATFYLFLGFLGLMALSFVIVWLHATIEVLHGR